MINKDLENFKIDLKEAEKKETTIKQYEGYIKEFIEYTNIKSKDDITKELLIDYKEHLKEMHGDKIASINIKIIILNKFITFLELPSNYKLKLLKEQRKSTLENVLSYEQYLRLLEWAKKLNKTQLYYLMLTLEGTGIRISELQFVTYEAIKQGCIDITNKGKSRKVPIRKSLQKELLNYCKDADITTGLVFKTKKDKLLDRCYIWKELQDLTGKARGGINKSKVHPHAFRHLFAKEFLESGNSELVLADILGHKSINTTRIYTTLSLDEQRKLLDNIDKAKRWLYA